MDLDVQVAVKSAVESDDGDAEHVGPLDRMRIGVVNFNQVRETVRDDPAALFVGVEAVFPVRVHVSQAVSPPQTANRYQSCVPGLMDDPGNHGRISGAFSLIMDSTYLLKKYAFNLS